MLIPNIAQERRIFDLSIGVYGRWRRDLSSELSLRHRFCHMCLRQNVIKRSRVRNISCDSGYRRGALWIGLVGDVEGWSTLVSPRAPNHTCVTPGAYAISKAFEPAGKVYVMQVWILFHPYLLEWKDKPLTLLLFVSNLVSILPLRCF
jgi:hypothetical protein